MTILRSAAHFLLRLDRKLTFVPPVQEGSVNEGSVNNGPYRTPGKTGKHLGKPGPARFVRPVPGRPGVWMADGQEVILTDSHFRILTIGPSEIIRPGNDTSWYILGWANASLSVDPQPQDIVRLIWADTNKTIIEAPVYDLDSYRKLLTVVRTKTMVSDEGLIDFYSKLGHAFGVIPEEVRHIIKFPNSLRLSFDGDSDLTVELFVIETSPA